MGCSGEPSPDPLEPIGCPFGAVPAPRCRWACASVGLLGGNPVMDWPVVWVFVLGAERWPVPGCSARPPVVVPVLWPVPPVLVPADPAPVPTVLAPPPAA